MKKRNVMAVIAVVVCLGMGFLIGRTSVSKEYERSLMEARERNGRLERELCLKNELFMLALSAQKDATEEPDNFVTAGEVLDANGTLAWLLYPFAVTSGRTPVKANLFTNEKWYDKANYSIVLEVPDAIFTNGSYSDITVYYPTTVKAGEVGTLAIQAGSTNGYVYCNFCQFQAEDDLQLVYGDSFAQTASGDEITVLDDYRLKIDFYTSATQDYYDVRDGFDVQMSDKGMLDVRFERYSAE